MTTLEDVIRKYALKNALDYGKAEKGAVVGKVIAEFPDAKKNMKETIQKINEIVNEVNKLSREAIENELKNYTFAEKPKEEKKRFEVPNAVEGKVVTRFPPEPSGYPHIGHAKAAFLDYELARQYNGKMILRFDDTNPEKESQEFVDAIKEGLRWLGIRWDKETYTSDNIEKIYECAETLIKKDKAYVCTCTQEEISRGRSESKPCQCRSLSVAENLERWKKMINGLFKEGEAILRFKGDLKALNTVMRDPSLVRIVDAVHYRQGKKYHAWPNYDLAVVVMDAIEEITHPMRTKEYELRDELYNALFYELGFKKPTLVEFSRLQIKNAPISKRLLTPLVKEKKVSGWDDPRLPTLMGLKRRGILPEAIKNFVLSFGISKVESEPTLDALLAENRKLVDQIAKRYFFVQYPVELKIIGAPPQLVRIRLHPTKNIGYREIAVKDKVFISKDDAEKLKEGERFRLKDLYNVKLKQKGAQFIAEYEKSDELLEKKIQWVSDEYVPCEILVPLDLLDEQGNFNENSLRVIKGYCENNCERLDEGEIIQFERFGFCRLDKKDPATRKLTFIYSC
jgi:glutamyl-tRNA synthetase